MSASVGAIVRQQTNAVVKRLADTLAHVAQQLPHSIVVAVFPARCRADGLGAVSKGCGDVLLKNKLSKINDTIDVGAPALVDWSAAAPQIQII